MFRLNGRSGVIAVTVLLLLCSCGDGGGDEAASATSNAGGNGSSTGSGGTGTGTGTGGNPAPGDDPAPGDGGPPPRTADPLPVPATIEAEDFDIGGDYVGYHDNVLGNQGGEYRTDTDVDIVMSTDPEGGAFDVTRFESGEWLAYTVLAGETVDYQVSLRVTGATAGSRVRVEIDGIDATGNLPVPVTGGGYEWMQPTQAALTAGQHTLKLHSGGEPFAVNALRVSQASTASFDRAGLLFKSGFEGAVVLGLPLLFGNGAWQDITGLDTETGQFWPPLLWGGTSSRLQLIAGDSDPLTGLLPGLPLNPLGLVEPLTALTLGNYVHNALETVAGRNGGNTRALYSHVQQSVGGATENWNSTQSSFQIHPGPNGQGDLYLSYWLQFQPDLVARMTENGWAGRVVSDWKTGSGTGGGGDYRVVFSVFGDGAANRLYWHIKGDNVANGGLPEQIFWEQTNSNVPVPVGRWFRVEVFVHRSAGSDGRVWVAVDGQQIFNRLGSNIGVNGLPWNRIMPFLNYSTGQILPAYQWVDDVELWDRFPAHASQH